MQGRSSECTRIWSRSHLEPSKLERHLDNCGSVPMPTIISGGSVLKSAPVSGTNATSIVSLFGVRSMLTPFNMAHMPSSRAMEAKD
ncbi:hypothetical protein GQX74_014596 [Glossina fuscipes]|nr:hypothetical protein GQX74_014596 [Glossina fuscipes]